MNNLLSYCGLTDARMRASEKDLPVQTAEFRAEHWLLSDDRNVAKCYALNSKNHMILIVFSQDIIIVLS